MYEELFPKSISSSVFFLQKKALALTWLMYKKNITNNQNIQIILNKKIRVATDFKILYVSFLPKQNQKQQRENNSGNG